MSSLLKQLLSTILSFEVRFAVTQEALQKIPMDLFFAGSGDARASLRRRMRRIKRTPATFA
jgi:hypothetical protein